MMPRSATPRPEVSLFAVGGRDSMVDAAGPLEPTATATLALAYFQVAGLPSRSENIPLEDFARAIRRPLPS